MMNAGSPIAQMIGSMVLAAMRPPVNQNAGAPIPPPFTALPFVDNNPFMRGQITPPPPANDPRPKPHLVQ